MDDYEQKYLKYKIKYFKLKSDLRQNIYLTGGKKNNKRTPNNIVLFNSNNHKDYAWRHDLPILKFAKKYNKKFYDIAGEKISLFTYEIFEQYLMSKWIKPNDIVLELGGRFGIVSATINMKLANSNKKLHVVVEPDEQAQPILLETRKKTNSKFVLCKYPINDNSVNFISSSESFGLGNYTESTNSTNSSNDDKLKVISIKNITHKEFFNTWKQKFNVLVADCEGCLCEFFNQNENILKQLEMIIFEMDNEQLCDYNKIYILLEKYNFILIDWIETKKYNADDSYELIKFQQVWIKNKN
jgi:hypothetical protein